jgi:hypothetical protein
MVLLVKRILMLQLELALHVVVVVMDADVSFGMAERLSTLALVLLFQICYLNFSFVFCLVKVDVRLIVWIGYIELWWLSCLQNLARLMIRCIESLVLSRDFDIGLPNCVRSMWLMILLIDRYWVLLFDISRFQNRWREDLWRRSRYGIVIVFIRIFI